VNILAVKMLNDFIQGMLGTLQPGRVGTVKVDVFERMSGTLGLLAAFIGKCNVGKPCPLAKNIPFGLAVAYKYEVGH
jgi:hypothetical protein